ncbi:MAG: tetratricopeptide repeat protein [candidate division WOR-3 bacterium]
MKRYLWIFGLFLFFLRCTPNLITAARIALQREEYKEAITHCRNHLKSDPKSVEAYLIMAKAQVFLAEYLEASDAIDIAFSLDSVRTKKQILAPEDRNSYWTIYNSAAYKLLSQEKFTEALKKTDRAIYIDDKRAEPYVIRGLVYARLKDRVKMQEAFNQALKIDPNLAEAYLNIGHIFYDETRWDSALTYYERAIDLYSKRKESNLKLLTGKAPTANPADVEQKIVELQLANKKDELENYVKTVLGFSGGVKEVGRQIETLVQANISMVTLYFNSAACAYNLGKTDKAGNYFESLIKIDPKHRDGLYYYGQILIARKEFKKASEIFTRIIEIDPDDKDGLFSLGYAFLLLKDYDKAIETYEIKYMKLVPDNPDAWVNLGLAYKGKGNAKKAYECIVKAEELKKRGK